MRTLALLIVCAAAAVAQTTADDAARLRGRPPCSPARTKNCVPYVGATGVQTGGSLGVASMQFPASDLICALHADALAQLTITGATNAAPIVLTVSASPVTAGYQTGQAVTVAGVTPSAYNGAYHVAALDATHITLDNGVAPGSSWSSGGTVNMTCNNQVTDGSTATAFATTFPVAANTLAANMLYRITAIVSVWSSSSAATIIPEIHFGSTRLALGINAETVNNSMSGAEVAMFSSLVLVKTPSLLLCAWQPPLAAIIPGTSNVTNPVAVNSTIDQSFNLKIHFGAATAGNAWKLLGWIVERVN